MPLAPENDHEMREPMLMHFRYSHLPEHLQRTSRMHNVLAYWYADNLPRCPERTVALRKLLEAKDAAVRAQLEGGNADLRPGTTGNEPVPGLVMGEAPDTQLDRDGG